MGEWLLHNLFWAFRGLGCLVFSFLLITAYIAVSSFIKKREFSYPMGQRETIGLHMFFWFSSLFSISSFAYGPDDKEYWSLRSVDYDDVLLGIEFSLAAHLILAVIIFGLSRFNFKKGK
jgi:hypothetical protein